MDYASALLQLYNALIQDASVQRLVDIAREYLGNPLHICDYNMQVIADSKEPGIKDKVWDMITSRDDHRHFEHLQIVREKNDLSKMEDNNKEPVLLGEGIFEHRIIGHYFWHDNKLLGCIMLFEYCQDFKDSDFSYIKEFGKIISYQIIRYNKLEFVRNPGTELALASLLNRHHITLESISRNLFPPDPAYHYVLSVVENIPGKTPYQLTYNLTILSVNIPDGRMVIYEDKIVMLFQCHKLQEIDWHKYEGLFKKHSFHCGVSNSFNNLNDIPTAYQEALSALRNSAILFPGGHIYKYFPLLHILNIVGQDNELIRFLHPAVTKLLDYDNVYNTKWFSSLVTFIFSGSNIQRTADIFGIHKNTMHYRIKKIEEITGYSLDNDIFIFSLKLSVFILYYNDPTTFYEKYGVPGLVTIFPKGS